MSSRTQDESRLMALAMTGAAAVTAQIVSGKATRDALFLTSLDYTTLPTMQQHWDIYRQENAAQGHTVNHVGFVPTRHIYLAATDEQAKAEALPTLAARWKELLRLARPDDMANGRWWPRRSVRGTERVFKGGDAVSTLSPVVHVP